MRYNMPHQREKEMGSKGRGTNSLKLFKPLPDKTGLKTNNEVFVPLFSPAKMKMFNPTPEQVVKYGMVGSGGLISVPEDLFTFYFKMSVHREVDFERLDGSVGFGYIVCPVKMNEYLTKVLGYGPMFDNPKCAYCEKEQEWWNEHNNRWAELGYTDEAKKSLATDDYRKMIDGDPVLKTTRSTARNYQSTDRYAIQIFDHSKVSNVRPLDEGQTSIEYQLWLAPKSIFDKLTNIYDTSSETVKQGLDVHFFDTSSPNGLHIINVIKDTSECTGNSMLRTKYDALAGKRAVYSPDHIAYLNNMNSMVDPSDFVFMLSYEEMRYYIMSNSGSDQNVGNQNAGGSQSQTNPSANPMSASPTMNMPVGGSGNPNPSVPTPSVPPVGFDQTTTGPPVGQNASPQVGNSSGGSPVPPLPSSQTQNPPIPVTTQAQGGAPSVVPQNQQSPVPVVPQVGPNNSGNPPLPDRTPPSNTPPGSRLKW